MKKILSLILTIVMLVGIIPALPVSAETDGHFTYEIAGGEVTITDCDTAIEGSIDIPSTLGGYLVTAIGDNAFENCSSLTSVTVPNSVVTIGAEAFASCEALESIDLPYYLTYIGADAFNGTALTHIQVPGATTIIYAAAFRGCQHLTLVSIAERVTEIRENAFADCPSLTDVGYSDTEYKWNMIDIQSGNDALLNATLHPIVIEYPEGPLESVAVPTISPAACEFNDSIDVTLSCETPGANIYYSLSFPNQDIETPAVMWLYTEPIHLTYTTILSVYAEKNGVMSEWVSATFTNRNELSTEPPVTEEPTAEPTEPPFVYEIPAPRVSVESGVVPYGTVVRITPVDGHFSYYVNEDFYYSYDFFEDITIYEDTVLRVESWKDVMDPNVTYIGSEATYTYTVDPSTIPSGDPTDEPTEPPVTEEPTAPPTTPPTEEPVGELSVSKSSVSVKVGKSVSVSAYLGDVDITDSATWNSKKDSIATVENGTITGEKAGYTTVSVSYGDQIKQIQVEVKTSGGGGGGGGGIVRPTAAPTATPTEIPTQAPIEGTTPFADVSESDWYFNAVSYAYESGLMNGVAEDEFSPESTITRAMFVTVLYRMAGEPTAEGALPFTDVPAESYYEKAVLWATENGIVSGISETLFAPDAKITREQMATMIYRYATMRGYGMAVGDGYTFKYADSSDISEYAYIPLAWCTVKDIINGMDDNTLRPKENATRAQAATIFMRLENVLSK